MALQRGQAAHQEIAEAAHKNRGSGFARLLIMKAGEKVLTRFRGFTRPLPSVDEEALKQKTNRDLMVLANQWQVYEKVEEGDYRTAMIERLLDRQKHYEPVTLTEDYCHAPGVKAIRMYTTCAKQWDGSDCIRCMLKDQGDKRFSAKVNANFSIVPQRKYHYVKGTTGNAKDNDFAYCSSYGYDAAGRCVYCARQVEAKQEGMKRFSVASMHANGVFACAERMSKKCASCEGLGLIHHVAWSCEICGEPFNNLVDETGAANVKCSCGHEGHPYEEVTCSRKCVDARRAQIFDTDILIERMGADKKTTYQFTEQYPFTPTEPDVLKFRVPNWESVLKPKDVDGQCRDTAIQVNPITNKPIAAAGPAAGVESYDDATDGAAAAEVQY